jgi:glycosyltransferase involved in cell wall biosynthesis
MRLLMISTIGPRVKDGLYVRPYNIAKALGKLHVDLYLTTFTRDLADLSGARVTALPENYYATFKRIPSILLLSSYLAKAIRKSAFNVIYAHQLPNILCSWLAVLRAGTSLPIIGDLHGLPSIEMRAWGNNVEACVDLQLELWLSRTCLGLVVASEAIREELLSRGFPSSKVHVVPNSVDAQEFRPLNRRDELRKLLNLPLDKTIVACTAPRSFTPNVMAIRHLYGVALQLEKRSPEILFVILGSGKVVKGKPRNVIYTGYVEDLNSYLNACDFAIAPYPQSAMSGGTRDKIVEYWACGLPVVSTPEGVRGFNSLGGRLPVMITGYDVQSLAHEIEQLATDPSLSRELAERGRALVLEEFNWEFQARRLSRIFHEYAPYQ